jgi:hypothetical protein
MATEHRQGRFIRMDGDNYIFDVHGTEFSFTREQIINISRPNSLQNTSILSQESNLSTLPRKRARINVGGVPILPPEQRASIEAEEIFASGALNESNNISRNTSSGGIDIDDIQVGDMAYLPVTIGGGAGGASGGASGGNGRRNRKKARKTQGGGKRKFRKSRKSRKIRHH